MRDLARHIDGVPDEDGLLQTIRPAQERFRRAIRATAPAFLPFEKRYAGKKSLEMAVFLSSEEGGEEIPEEPVSFGSLAESPAGGEIYVDEVLARAQL